MALPEWQGLLRRYGAGPPQAMTGIALRHAIEIANEVREADMTGGVRMPIRHILAAVAVGIAKAHTKRKKVSSLAFIAERLVRSVTEEFNTAAVYDLPPTITDAAYAGAHEVATDLLANDTRGALAREPLMSTVGVEELAGIIAEHGGEGAIYLGWAHACQQNRWPENAVYVSWSWLVPNIEAAKTNAARTGAKGRRR